VIGELVAKLIAAGTPADVAAVVVTEAFAAGIMSVGHVTSADESVTHRRESDRLRKQRSRDRLVTNRDVTGQSQDASLSKNNLEEEREAKLGSVRGQRLPDDWVPSGGEKEAAKGSLSETELNRELAKFRDHWKQQPGAKGLSLDWDAAWRIWIRRAEDYAGRQKPANGAAAGPVDKELFWNHVCTSFKKFGKWHHDAGPDPDSPACKCPREILEKHELLRRASA
jgi:hypothetical protein